MKLSSKDFQDTSQYIQCISWLCQTGHATSSCQRLSVVQFHHRYALNKMKYKEYNSNIQEIYINYIIGCFTLKWDGQLWTIFHHQNTIFPIEPMKKSVSLSHLLCFGLCEQLPPPKSGCTVINFNGFNTSKDLCLDCDIQFNAWQTRFKLKTLSHLNGLSFSISLSLLLFAVT